MHKQALHLLSAVVLLFFCQSAGAVSVNWGALATASISYCDDPLCLTATTVSDDDAGENMMSDANASISDAGGNEATATALFSGTSAAFTPVLGVFATANGTDLAVATASGIQGYTNPGGDTTLTLELALSIDQLAGPLAGVSAFAAVFLTDVLEITGDTIDDAILGAGFGSAIGSASLGAITGLGELNQTTNFSFDLPAGENFLIWAGLQAFASGGSIADASNTFELRLLDASGAPIDAGLYDVASERVGVIPLPAGIWLFLGGLWVIGTLVHHQNRIRQH